MSLLVRRDLIIVGANPEVGALANVRPPTRLGQPWLEEIPVVLEGAPIAHDPRRITPDAFCDSWGTWDPKGRELVRLRRRTLASLWGDPFADYLQQQQPDVFHGSSGGLWLRDDVWRGNDGTELVRAEWLPAGAVAWSRDGRRVAFTSVVPHTWGKGTLLLSVVDLDSNDVSRFGPWPDGPPDVLEWTPASDGLVFVLRDDDGGEYAHLLDLRSGVYCPLDLGPNAQGVAWRADGRALVVANGGDEPGLAVYRDDGTADEYPVGPAWTPVWAGDGHVAFGSPAEEPSPGDRIMVLRLEDPDLAALMGAEPVTESIWSAARISDWRCVEQQNPTSWWSTFVREEEAGPAPRIEDPRTLSPEASAYVHPELELLFYDDPALYRAHEHLW